MLHCFLNKYIIYRGCRHTAIKSKPEVTLDYRAGWRMILPLRMLLKATANSCYHKATSSREPSLICSPAERVHFLSVLPSNFLYLSQGIIHVYGIICVCVHVVSLLLHWVPLSLTNPCTAYYSQAQKWVLESNHGFSFVFFFFLLVKIFPNINLKNLIYLPRPSSNVPSFVKPKITLPGKGSSFFPCSYSTFFIPLLCHLYCVVAVYLPSYDSAWYIIGTWHMFIELKNPQTACRLFPFLPHQFGWRVGVRVPKEWRPLE